MLSAVRRHTKKNWTEKVGAVRKVCRCEPVTDVTGVAAPRLNGNRLVLLPRCLKIRGIATPACALVRNDGAFSNSPVGFVLDRATQEYVPNTVVREDIRDLTRCALRVIAVYRKEASALRYEELTYAAMDLGLLELEYPKALAYLK